MKILSDIHGLKNFTCVHPGLKKVPEVVLNQREELNHEKNRALGLRKQLSTQTGNTGNPGRRPFGAQGRLDQEDRGL